MGFCWLDNMEDEVCNIFEINFFYSQCVWNMEVYNDILWVVLGVFSFICMLVFIDYGMVVFGFGDWIIYNCWINVIFKGFNQVDDVCDDDVFVFIEVVVNEVI